jgi:tetratricopeptide (TPR) repeat protein
LEKAISIRPEFFEEPRTFQVPLSSGQTKVVTERLEAERPQESGPARQAAWHFERMAIAQGADSGSYGGAGEQENFLKALASFKSGMSSHRSGSAGTAKEDAGLKLFQAKRYEAAAPLLADTVKGRRLTRRARISLAQCYFETRRPDEAINVLWALDPVRGHDWEAAYWLGRSYQELATSSLDHMINVAPDSYRAHQLSAEFYRLKKNSPAAIKEYRRALELQPKAPGLHLAIGFIYTEERNYNQAIAELEEELQISPSSELAKAGLGRIYAARHDPARAVSYLQAALEIDPTIPGAHADLARALEEQGKIREALNELQKAAREDSDGSIHYRLFRLYQRLGEPAEAQQALSISEKLRRAVNPGGKLTEQTGEEPANSDSGQPDHQSLPHH